MKIGIDLDGTVYRSTTIINNAKEALVDIGQDHEIYYLTNNSSKSPEQLVKKLSMLSDIAIATDKFVTPLLVSIGSLEKNKKIFIYGTEFVINYMKQFNYNITDTLDESDLLIIGRVPNYSEKNIESFCHYHNTSRPIFAFNKDLTYPTEKGFEPGNGAIISEIENRLGLNIESFGKPDDYFIDYLDDNDINLDFIVGDRLDTDIRLGTKLQIQTALVKTGVYRDSDPIPEDLNPIILDDLFAFSKYLLFNK